MNSYTDLRQDINSLNGPSSVYQFGQEPLNESINTKENSGGCDNEIDGDKNKDGSVNSSIKALNLKKNSSKKSVLLTPIKAS